MPAIDRSTAEALAQGRHPDPFSVLGLHDGWITVLLPEAQKVTAFDDAGETVLFAVCPGIFCGAWDRSDYRLRAKGGTSEWEFEDAYRFGPVLGQIDEYLIGEGTHRRLWQALGAHLITHEGVPGVHFAVWAPGARRVSVVGAFNTYDGRRHQMRHRGATGVWEIFVPHIGTDEAYQYEILGADGALCPLKADPVGFGAQAAPGTASVVRSLTEHEWTDAAWMKGRAPRQTIHAPMSIYEVHAGSWRRVAQQGNRSLSYLELADQLVDYVADMGFTHIEFLPLSEHPFDGSWGYQPVGLYAPTARFGPPEDFAALVDAAHRRGIGVILDWVPGHFPTDDYGLRRFDGTALYEYADPREGFHQDWNTLIYNYGRREVANYLKANALFWLQEYHADGLRVDAVASMLYRDYSRPAGTWVPNQYGGRENLEAIAFLQDTNRVAYGEHPGIAMFAEESTTYSGVTRAVDKGGLGFGFKWNMGWMNDWLRYFARDPVYRRWNHNELTFASSYAYSENFVLPISHDEVVHGKGSMIGKMPGGTLDRFANLRAFYALMWTHPGKKLLFMGQEFAQWAEWNHDAQLDWPLLDAPMHSGVQTLVRDLNHLYRTNKAMHWGDCEPSGFAWIEADDALHSVYVFERRAPGVPPVVVAANLTPVERTIPIGFPQAGDWREILNTDGAIYGGANWGNMGVITARETPVQHHPFGAEVYLPPLSVVVFMPDEAQ